VVDNKGTKTNDLSIYNHNMATDVNTLSLVGVPGMAPFTLPIAYQGDTLIYHSEYMYHGTKMYNRRLNVFRTSSNHTYFIYSASD
jgi:hypothetical protein